MLVWFSERTATTDGSICCSTAFSVGGTEFVNERNIYSKLLKEKGEIPQK